jgi:predicted GNAT family N-acyltransferase
MAQTQRKPLLEIADPKRHGRPADPARHGKHKLDELDAARVARHLILFHPTEDVVTELMARARKEIPGLADTDVVQKVLSYNPACMFAVARKSKYDPKHPVGEGFIAVLPLNQMGLQQLALGYFDGGDPDLRFIAKPYERPAGIYMWGVYTPGALAPAIALFMEEMKTPQYAGVSLYSRPNTEIGVRFNEVLGATKGIRVSTIESPNVWVFSRVLPRPLYDTYVPGQAKGEIGVTVARNFEDMMRVAAIRNAVYIGEQECPYEEEYDGNDLSATHLLAYIGNEPVGCLRLRFFAGFAKFERMAIRKEFRRSRAAIQLARAGFKLCQKKGYNRVVGHIQEPLVPFWSRFGFRVKPDTKRFVFSDYEYVEIVAEIEADPEAITLNADPYVLIRPEGQWHVQGVLERSAERVGAMGVQGPKPVVRRRQ